MKLKPILITLAVLVLLAGCAWIRSNNQQIIPMNNKKCPYSGQPVNECDTYVHKGKQYKLCNEKCKQPLSENPDKYLCD